MCWGSGWSSHSRTGGLRGGRRPGADERRTGLARGRARRELGGNMSEKQANDERAFGEDLTRRDFLRWVGIAGAAVGVGGVSGVLAGCSSSTPRPRGGCERRHRHDRGLDRHDQREAPRRAARSRSATSARRRVRWPASARPTPSSSTAQDQLGNGITIAGTTYPVEIIERTASPNPDRAAQVAGDLITQRPDRPDAGRLDARDHEPGRRPVRGQRRALHLHRARRGSRGSSAARATRPRSASSGRTTASGASRTSSRCSPPCGLRSRPTRSSAPCCRTTATATRWGDAKLGFPPVLTKAGYTVVDPGRYPTAPRTSPRRSPVQEGRCRRSSPASRSRRTSTNFWNQAPQQGFKPKIATVGKALLFPSVVEALGDDRRGNRREVWWGPMSPVQVRRLTGQTCQELADAYTAADGEAVDAAARLRYSIYEIAADALKRTQDPHNKDEIIAAIVATQSGHHRRPGRLAGEGSRCPTSRRPRRVGGQWRLTDGGAFKYDIVIVEDGVAPMVPTSSKMEAIKYA